MMKRTILSLAASLLLFGGSPAFAQGVTSSLQRTSIVVPSLLYINVTNTTLAYPTVGTSDYAAGYVTASASSAITHNGNIVHSVDVKANASTMTATGVGARASKPASDLQLSVGGGAWTGLSTTDLAIVTSVAAGAYSGSPSVSYRVLLSWSQDTPGTYTLGFTYTIVAN